GETGVRADVVGETGVRADVVGETGVRADVVGYEVLCRRHHMRRMTAASARAVSPSPDTLPLDLDAWAVPPRR
ncbi:MAG: hypothetical protein JJE50_07340, partial [Actinomycetales bacterium]|nr:hypothetical protein [Actinomycetales bacterium]